MFQRARSVKLSSSCSHTEYYRLFPSSTAKVQIQRFKSVSLSEHGLSPSFCHIPALVEMVWERPQHGRCEGNTLLLIPTGWEEMAVPRDQSELPQDIYRKRG